jgi:hypothetical protein
MDKPDKVEKVTQIVINGQIPEKLGKKIKLYKTEEFKGLNVNDIIQKAKELQQQEGSDTVR